MREFAGLETGRASMHRAFLLSKAACRRLSAPRRKCHFVRHGNPQMVNHRSSQANQPRLFLVV